MKHLLLFVLLMCTVAAGAQDFRLRRNRFNNNTSSYSNSNRQEKISSDKKRNYGDADLVRMAKVSSPKAKKLKKMALIGGGVAAILGAACLIDDEGDTGEPFITGMVIIGAGVAWTTGFLIAANNAKNKEYLYSSRIIQRNIEISNSNTLTPSIDLIRDQAMHTRTVGLGLSFTF